MKHHKKVLETTYYSLKKNGWKYKDEGDFTLNSESVCYLLKFQEEEIKQREQDGG